MTKSRLNSYASAGLIVLSLAGVAPAQDKHFGYVEEPLNPRAVGMGCTGTAGGTGGFSFYNPAGAGMVESSFVAFEYGQQWSDISRGSVETAWIFRQWFAGGSFQTQSLSFQPTSDVGEMLAGSGSEQASLLAVLVGWRNERFALGATINGLQHHLFDGDAYALSVSGGAALSIIPEKLIAGAALLQAGGYHRGFYRPTFEIDRSVMPTSARLGGTWNDTIRGKIPVTLSLDAVYSSNYRSMTVPVGFEIRPVRPLAVRLGKRFNLLTDLFTFGIGIFWQNISFDAAFTPSTIEGDIEMKWLMGLRYALAVKKRNAPHAGAKPPPPPAGPPAVVPEADTVTVAPPIHPADTTEAVPEAAVDSVNRQADTTAIAAEDSASPAGEAPAATDSSGTTGAAPDSAITAVPSIDAAGAGTPPPVTDDSTTAPRIPADSADGGRPAGQSGNGDGASAGSAPGDTAPP